MAAVIDICNGALYKLGASHITSLDQNTKAAKILKDIYPVQRDTLLRAHTWKFASKRAILAPDTAVPLFEFEVQFSLPSDLLRLLKVYDSVEYKLEGNKILASGTQLNISYIRQVLEVNEMDSLFRDLFETLLARELAIPITDSSDKYTAMAASYEEKLSEALSVGSMEDYPVEVEANDWIIARRIG